MPRRPSDRRSHACTCVGLAALLAAGALPGTVAAQTSGGLVVGVSASTITGSTVTDFTPRTAFGARLWVETEVRSGVSVGAGLVYAQRGADGTTTVGRLFPDEAFADPDRPVRFRLDHGFLDIPVTVGLAGPEIGRWRTQAYAGPYLGLRQNAGIDYGLDGQPFEGREADPSVQSPEWGVVGGLTGRIDASTFGDLVVGVHLTRSLTNLRTSDPPLHALAGLVSVGVGF